MTTKVCNASFKPRKRCKNHPWRDFVRYRPEHGWRVERRYCERCGELLSVKRVRSEDAR